MISVILYGRNDNYGYNLHKRAALSINCIAEVLTAEDDEIIFVDYNTPNDFPTMPEAIADTLTNKAKEKLRIIRVRPEAHKRFAHLTHLVALEPIARNVGLTRSNPRNSWVLSTNTDMIFVPEGGSLSEIVASLPPNHYGIPRFEIPETLWESFDRSAPSRTIENVSNLAVRHHLHQIVLSAKPHMFDAPGDFQLMPRQTLLEIHGFDEEMLLGWHVDSNIAKRLSFIYGDVKDLSSSISGYHCDHTRQITPAHKKSSPANDMVKFVDSISVAKVAEQTTFGLSDLELEEIRLNDLEQSRYVAALERSVPEGQIGRNDVSYVTESFGKTAIPDEHVLPFLLDLTFTENRKKQFYWVGNFGKLGEYFQKSLRDLGFANEIKKIENSRQVLNINDEEGNFFVFRFGNKREGDSNGESVTQIFHEITSLEASTRVGSPINKFVGIDVSHNLHEKLFDSRIQTARTPFSIGIKHGFLDLDFSDENGTFATDKFRDFSSKLSAEAAGFRKNGLVYAKGGTPGCVAYGPFDAPPPGTYKLRVELNEFKRVKSNLTVNALLLILKRIWKRGDKVTSILPLAAGPVFVLGKLLFIPLGTVYLDVYFGTDLLGRSLFMPGMKKLKSKIPIEISTKLAINNDFSGLDIRVMTSGHWAFKIYKCELSLLRKA